MKAIIREFRCLKLMENYIFQTEFSGAIVIVAKDLNGVLWARLAFPSFMYESVWINWINIENLQCKNSTGDDLWEIIVQVLQPGEIYFCKGSHIDDINNWSFCEKEAQELQEIWNDIKRKSKGQNVHH